MISSRIRPATSFEPFEAQCDAVQIKTCRFVQYIALPLRPVGRARTPGDVIELEAGDDARPTRDAAILVNLQPTVGTRLKRSRRATRDALVTAAMQAYVRVVQCGNLRPFLHALQQQIGRFRVE
jgi:uncharacterized radical SAM superfamily protein